MGDKALRGNRLTKQRRMGPTGQRRMGRSAPKEEMTGNEALGLMATGGWKGKPHSTKEIRFDIKTNTLEKLKPKKGPSKSLQAGTRRFNKGGKV